MMSNGEEAAAATHQDRSRCCFQRWMQLQRLDLTQLLESLHKPNDEIVAHGSINNCIAHFHDYIATRARLAEEGAWPFFAPTWCSSLENSLLWMAGCRPSIFIRLIYALGGCEVDVRLGQWMEGVRRMNGRVGDLTPRQMVRVNELHVKTIHAEQKLTHETAALQEALAYQPIAVIETETEAADETADVALKEHDIAMGRMMAAADELRMNTLKEVIEILEPSQAVEFLVASKKLHLSLHQWGKGRDNRHGRRH